jgi:sensor histidine kinase YesM
MLTNPIFKDLKNLNYYLIFWTVLAFLFIQLLYIGTDIGLTASITDGLVFTFLLGGIGLTLWYPARYIPIEKNSPLKIISGHSIGALITTVIWLSVGYFLLVGLFNFNTTYPPFFYSTLAWRILIGLLFYSLFVSFYYMIIYYTGFHEREIKEAELKSLVTEAELKSLKFQINPHFIFNSLNSMSALTELDPAKAKKMILKLADCTNVEIPSMILQPLFENAIKHAVYETLDKVTLKLFCKIQNEFLKIVVQNNFDEAGIAKKGAGVGLKNIEERLKLIYHQNNLLEVKKDKDIFKVTLYIPIEEN